MGHVAALDRLHVLDAYELADHAGMDGLIHCPEIRAVSEHVADCYDVTIFVGLLCDIRALFSLCATGFSRSTSYPHSRAFMHGS